jgi:ElaB/YqjD/DUF883 family membrane-anchored ribosome-binding protein
MNNIEPIHPRVDFRHELVSLLTETEALLSGKLSEQTAEATANLRLRLAAARDRCSAAFDKAKQTVVAGARCTDTAIRENPYQAIAVTLGTGLLLGALAGMLFGRRSA